jgi:hypothetical protein
MSLKGALSIRGSIEKVGGSGVNIEIISGFVFRIACTCL